MQTDEEDKAAVSDNAGGSEGEDIESEGTASRPGLGGYWDRYMGVESPYRSVILTVLTIVILVNLKVYLTRVMRRKLKEIPLSDITARNGKPRSKITKVWSTPSSPRNSMW